MFNHGHFRNSKSHTPELYTSAQGPHHLDFGRSFQKKYILYLVISILSIMTLFLGVAYYELSQNYLIFKKLAFHSDAKLVMHLEREMLWFKMFLLTSLLSVLVFTLIIGYRMTKSLLSPIKKVENHLHNLSIGKWTKKDFKIDFEDELPELLETYAYFYQYLKYSVESDIKLLKTLAIDPNNRESYTNWKRLIYQKEKLFAEVQTEHANDANAVKTEPLPSSHLAS